MQQKKRKPIPTTVWFNIGMLVIAMGLFVYEQYISAVLIIMLVSIVGVIDLLMLPCATVLLRDKVKKKELRVYKNFAKFYLSNRRLAYSKGNFEKAIDNNWIDIATMFILLGIQKNYEKSERDTLLLKVFKKDYGKIFEVLTKGGFKGDFRIEETGEPFIFETLKQDNPLYLELLLKGKVEPDQLNLENETPIYITIKESLNEHLQVLLKYSTDLNQLNKEGLTPLFYAVKEGNIEACELIYDKIQTEKQPHEIKFEALKDPLLMNQPHAKGDTELMIKLIASKDRVTLEILEQYFKNKKDYRLDVQTGVELYVRLSRIEATMEQHEAVTHEVQEMSSEEECKKDLYHYILKRYKFSPVGKFNIDRIYKTPKCIDSFKEPCKQCNGSGEMTCSHCDGQGEEPCETCHGTGETVCTKCQGTLKMSCKALNKYIECKTCQKGNYTCVHCDDKGIAECPECNGRGVARCTCPKDKKIKCPHCDKGYIFIKDGMYKKCPHCDGGEMCGLCQNTGWVNEKFKDKGYACKVCKGTKRITCHKCKGTKKIKCKKYYEMDCDCQTGKQVCETCEGSAKVPCKQCLGSKKEKCTECTEGYIYTNVSIDFKAKQVLQDEMIVGQNSKKVILKDLLPHMVDKVCSADEMINKVYTLIRVDLKTSDVLIRNASMQEQVHQMIKNKSEEGMLDILELVPLEYTRITFEERSGNRMESILVGENFFKSYNG